MVGCCGKAVDGAAPRELREALDRHQAARKIRILKKPDTVQRRVSSHQTWPGKNGRAATWTVILWPLPQRRRVDLPTKCVWRKACFPPHDWAGLNRAQKCLQGKLGQGKGLRFSLIARGINIWFGVLLKGTETCGQKMPGTSSSCWATAARSVSRINSCLIEFLENLSQYINIVVCHRIVCHVVHSEVHDFPAQLKDKHEETLLFVIKSHKMTKQAIHWSWILLYVLFGSSTLDGFEWCSHVGRFNSRSLAPFISSISLDTDPHPVQFNWMSLL